MPTHPRDNARSAGGRTIHIPIVNDQPSQEPPEWFNQPENAPRETNVVAHPDEAAGRHHDLTATSPEPTTPPTPQWTEDEKKIILDSWWHRLRNSLKGGNHDEVLLKPNKAQRALIEQLHENLRRAAEAEAVRREEEAERQRFLTKLNLSILRLRWLASVPDLQPVVTVANIKGGASKTTTALYLGAVIAEYTRKFALVLPATHNTSTSNVSLVAGIKEGVTITFSELNRDIKQYGAYRALSMRVPRTPAGLGVVSEDVDEDINIVNTHTADDFKETIGTIRPNVDFLILDTGNDDINLTSIPLAAVRLSTALVFTSTADAVYTQQKLPSTMRFYQTDTAWTRPAEEVDTPSVATPQKVSNAIVLVSKVRPDDHIDFEDLVRSSVQSAHASPTLPFCGTTMTVPYDDYMGRSVQYLGRNVPPPCNIYKISQVTLMAYLELAIACYETSARLQGIDLQQRFESADEETRRHLQKGTLS